MSVAVTKLSHAEVALFGDSSYVDTATPNSGFRNIKAGLKSLGHSVTVFDGLSRSDFRHALAGTDVLVFPTLTGLLPALAPGAIGAIDDFIAGGGTLVLAGSESGRDEGLVNQLLGTALSEGNSSNGSQLTENAATAGTTFASNPTHVSANNGTFTVYTPSLPSNALSLYHLAANTNDSAASIIPLGRGQVVLLSWDWFDAKPNFAQDGGWLKMLASAISVGNGTIVGTPAGETFDETHAPPGEAFTSNAADKVFGNKGGDYLLGLGGSDTLHGGRGPDYVAGGRGNDRLYGDNGDDYLYDQEGAGSRMWGGNGSDKFAFSIPMTGDPTTIMDFQSGEDILFLDQNEFTGLARGILSASAFHKGSLATMDPSDRIIYAGNGKVFFDTDGSGPDPSYHFATLAGHPVLKASDIDVQPFG